MYNLHAAFAWVILECFLILAKSQGYALIMKLFEFKNMQCKIFFKLNTLQADMKINLGKKTFLTNHLKVSIRLKACFLF